MADVLYVNLDALTTEYNKKIDAAIGRLEKFGENAIKNTNKANDSGQNFGKNLINMAKGFIAVDLAGKIASAIKQAFMLEESLKTALMPLQGITEKTGNFGRVLDFNKGLADKYGQSIFVLAEEYKSLYATSETAGLSLNATNSIYESLIKTGAGLKLSNERISLSMRAITQMIDKQVVSSEELKQQLAEHIPGAYGLMAKAAKDAGISITGSTQELAKLLEEGKVASNVVLPFFAKRMEEAFGGKADQNINTISGSANRFKNELTYLMEALDNGRVLSFWANMQNGIANVFKDLTFYLNQGSWKEFISGFNSAGGGLRGKREKNEDYIKKDIQYFNSLPFEKRNELYKKLNKELAGEVAKNRDILSKNFWGDAAYVDTEYMTNLAAQVRRYKDNLSDPNKTNGNPPITPKGGSGGKDLKDYTFEIKLLDLETEQARKRISELYAEIEKTKQNGFTPQLAVNTGVLNEEKLNWFNQMSKAVGFDGESSTKKLQERYKNLADNITPIVNSGMKKISTIFGDITNENFGEIKGYIEQGVGMLGDTLSQGFAALFNKDIKFDFKKLIGGFLSALGDMLIKLGSAELTAGILMNIATPGAGMGKVLGGGKMLAFGAALKGGGMAMSANSNIGSTSNSNNNNGNTTGPGMNRNTFNVTFEPIRFDVQGSTLKGIIDVANYQFG